MRTLITKALIAHKSWEEIKDSLCLKISNADIHTSISCFMDIQQTDKESLATYVHRFKWEANRCKFNNDATTIRIFLKGLKNAHTIATKVYEKGPQTLSEAIKEVEKLQATQQITSSLLPTSSFNTMSSDNDRCFQCQEVGHMARYCPHIRCYDCDTYGHVAMDCLDKILQVHQPAAGLTLMTEVEGLLLDITATPDAHAMSTGTDLDSVALDPDLITTAIGVVAAMTLIEVYPDHSTDLPITISQVIEAPVPTTAIATHPTADLLLIGIPPEMTADLDIDLGNNTTNQPKDLHPLHTHHPGNLRTGNISRSQLTTHHWNTIAQTTMTVTPMMI